MEWIVDNPTYGFKQRKYCNSCMRNIHVYIDDNALKATTEGYNEVIDRININDLPQAPVLRSAEEKTADEQEYLNGNS